MRKIVFVILLLSSFSSPAQNVDESRYQDLKYRLIGPFRASRTVGAVGIPSQPATFFVGVNNGGVWKTTDFGRTWNPIFDDAPTGSVGDIAVSPVNPNIMYVGSGEGLHRPDLGVGDGIFKSTDGGSTWKHIGLHDIQQVGRLIIHPTNPDIVYVAGLGHPYGPNEQRGVFRTVDGGDSWEKVLYIDHNTGAIQVEFDPSDPEIIYADMWEHREGPWENARFSGDNSGLFKSTNGGTTWKKLTTGLPEKVGRIGVGISPSNPKVIYATVDAGDLGGIYISSDAGESWRRISDDRRLWGRGGDFGEIKVHPKDENIVFVGNIASYKSEDGGVSWTSLKGAPGGDDYHRIWINPNQPDIMIFAADQGATITVNGGKTWSSWYNQPTAQIYHVNTDNQFPYWVYGGQQESGAIGTASRGNGGQISFRDWMGVGADEYAYVAPDPKDHNIIYGGRVIRFNKQTGQSQNVAPEAVRSGKYRILRTMPLMFHPLDPNMLLFATNVLWQTFDGGHSWKTISPDLSNPEPRLRESIGDFLTEEMNNMDRRGVIYALSPSPIDIGTIWAGTDDGLVHVTIDGGKNWADVTPQELDGWDKISQIDAGHFDGKSAYIAVNAIRNDNILPIIYKTHDLGKTWTKIVSGLPENGPINVVREDPKQPGLLFAGSERTVYFSSDDGGNWQSLRQNLPPSSIRDLVIHEDDLVIGTHGRSIFIMDNIGPLRESNTSLSTPHLFDPPLATRVRWNMFLDTPLPPEEPAGQNPPDGAILDYYLDQDYEIVSLKVLDENGSLVRSFSSTDSPEDIDSVNYPHPTYWIRPQKELDTSSGHHRFIWDLRHEPFKGAQRQYAISAVHKRTPSGPNGPFVAPGSYSVHLTVDGQEFEEKLIVRIDPRVNTPKEDLDLQNEYSIKCYRAYHELQGLKEDLVEKKKNLKGRKLARVEALIGSDQIGNADILYGSIYISSPAEETISGLQQKLIYMVEILQSADTKPTTQAINGVNQLTELKEQLEGRANEF